MEIKYHKKVHSLSQRNIRDADGTYPDFTFAKVQGKGKNKAYFFLRYAIPFISFFLRKFWPNVRIGKTIIVTKRKDIQFVLGNESKSFAVPYGPEMSQLGGGGKNVLGMDGPEHKKLRNTLASALNKGDLEEIKKSVYADSVALLDGGNGKIDVARDLITRTATEVCSRFFGIYISNPEQFAHWSMAVSNQLFADFTLSSNANWEQAQVGSAQLQSLIQDSIDRIHRFNAIHPAQRETTTLIDRLITNEKMSDSDVKSTVIEMITAFVPTNTLAAGNMLDVILSKPKLLRAAKNAAEHADYAEMRNIALEAGRLFPALTPGLWRRVIKADTIGKLKVREGDLVLTILPSGLRDLDSKNIKGSHSDAWLMFGSGPHDCFGAEMALAHITSVFIALFERNGLKQASGKYGKPYKIGVFYDQWEFTYDHLNPRGGHVIMTFEGKQNVDRETLREKIKALNAPEHQGVRKGIRDSFWNEDNLQTGDFGRVQFSSLSVVERAPNSAESIIIFEINGDGDPDSLIEYISGKCESWLSLLLKETVEGAATLDSADALAAYLKKHINKLHFKPWGTTGLLHEGLPGLSVKDIHVNAELSAKTKVIIDEYLTAPERYRLELKAAHILRYARRVLTGDKLSTFTEKSEGSQLKVDGADRIALIRPGRHKLTLTKFEKWKSIWEPLPKMVFARKNSIIWIIAGSLLLLLGVLLYAALAKQLVLTLILSVILILPVTGVLLAFCIAKLGKLEQADIADKNPAAKEHLDRITDSENPANHVHNHIVAVMPFKPGLFRRFSFAFVMWATMQTIKYWFRPGFVVTMGTIHVARWFRIKGTNMFGFLSNYDGTWESYLEDFITRANQGQSAAWSHGEGFPETRHLIGKGAEDGDSFKIWVRKQQRESLFWYSRFPEMTTEQIRRDAMIVDGLSKGANDSDARKWLGYFGSEQRQAREMESQEIQSLAFTGFPKQDHADAVFIKLPREKTEIARYLRAISGIEIEIKPAFMKNLKIPFHWGSDGKYNLRLEARLRFGDSRIAYGGLTLGLTSRGLMKAGLKGTGAKRSFPYAFDVGMSQRSRILGDNPDELKNWRFSDNPDAHQGADAVLLIYGYEHSLIGKNEYGEDEFYTGTHEELVDAHIALLEEMGGSVVHQIPCSPVKPEGHDEASLKFEHFGFRDGISQPVIQGTDRDKNTPERDIIAPGEFIGGYQNHQGYVSPPISVNSIFDPGQNLSNCSSDESNDFPHFGLDPSSEDLRDFSYNGFYFAIRQLDQDVAGFQHEMKRAADDLKSRYSEADELVGGNLSDAWVAAKVIGRWRDGTPLIGNKTCPMDLTSDQKPFNDFTYGEDDPRGYACPLGSHIRRTNPRDSMEPGNVEEQMITNRHRLLRRGRSYEYAVTTDGTKDNEDPKSTNKKGLLFMSVCGDLERQFEFVQRTWINKTGFHGLKNEHDPLMGGPNPETSKSTGGQYTIPTPSGPLRIPDLKSYVTLQGGGYFFMPSRASLGFLINRSEQEKS